MKHFSYSQYKTFLNCPYRYYKKYIKRNKELPNEILINGIEKHNEIEQIIRNKQYLEASPRLNNFLDYILYKNKNILNYNLEESFEINKNNYKIVGKIDLYIIYKDGKITIVDWKTGYSSGDNEQLKSYAYLLLNKLPNNFKYFECIFFYIENDYYEKTLFSLEDILSFKNKLENKFNEILSLKEDQFIRKPNQYCSSCSSLDECIDNELKNFHIPENIKTDEDAISLLRKIKLCEAFISDGKDKIKEYMINNNKMMIADKDTFLKASYTHSISLKIGQMTKDDLINIIISMNKNDGKTKTELSKLKKNDLIEILKR